MITIVIFFLPFVLSLLAWLLWLVTKNLAIIDVFWPINITLVAVAWLLTTPLLPSQWLMLIAVLLWGVRLTVHLLYYRIIPGVVDRRYEKLTAVWQSALGRLSNFWMQAGLSLVISVPFWWLRQLPEPSALVYFGCILIFLGVIGEALADHQLQMFRKDYPGKVCNGGLWRYARHPNYFFELLIWYGFAASACSVPWGFIALISPLLLTFLMVKVTGPITEAASLESKGDAFAQYQKQVSYIIPWFPRKPF